MRESTSITTTVHSNNSGNSGSCSVVERPTGPGGAEAPFRSVVMTHCWAIMTTDGH